MLYPEKPAPSHREHYPKKQPLLHRGDTTTPRCDLRMPRPPRQVRLFMGEGLFYPQDAPLI